MQSSSLGYAVSPFLDEPFSKTFNKLPFNQKQPISEPCVEGTYRDSTTTFCVDCGAGNQFNSDKSECGKNELI